MSCDGCPFNLFDLLVGLSFEFAFVKKKNITYKMKKKKRADFPVQIMYTFAIFD